MSFEKLLKEKNKRLEEVPKIFDATKKVQKRIYKDILDKVSQLDTDNTGKFILSKKNLLLAEEINASLSDITLASDYTSLVREFASEFEGQKNINDKILEKAFKTKHLSEIADQVNANSKKSAVELLVGDGLSADFINPIKGILTESVNAGSSFADTVLAIRDFVEGEEDADGKLLAYSRQIATDTFAIADRSYTNAVSEENDYEWFYYSGGVIEPRYSGTGRQIGGTRCFCLERNEQYFYYKEIEAWGLGNVTDGVSKDCGFPWSGMNDSTNESTIFNYAGGWNCQHSIQPVSLFAVPIEVVQRNIDKGYFEPTDGEREELGL